MNYMAAILCYGCSALAYNLGIALAIDIITFQLIVLLVSGYNL